jgi:hypothetical protein
MQDFVTTFGKSFSLSFYLQSLNAELHILYAQVTAYKPTKFQNNHNNNIAVQDL